MIDGLSVKVNGAAQLNATMTRLGAELANMPRSVHADAGRRVEQAGSRTTPRRSGALARSVHSDIRPDGPVTSWRIRYAPFVEYGTRRMRGRRYAQRARESAAPAVTQVYDEHVRRAADRVRGA